MINNCLILINIMYKYTDSKISYKTKKHYNIEVDISFMVLLYLNAKDALNLL